ncbi:SNF2 family N-terminal domain-containing protein [Flammula alnicola]|nr:SNF2 family N-terminal domain-containing protein [Flammula alnicola]
MRETHSNHNESIRAQAVHSWPTRYPTTAFRPNLNISTFTDIVSTAVVDDVSVSKSSNKRKATKGETRSSKRARTSVGSRRSQSDSDESAEPKQIEVEYPTVEVASNHINPDSEIVPVLRHVLEIQYVNDEDSRRTGYLAPAAHTLEKWDTEDGTLRDLLLSLSESISSPRMIDLGEVLLGEHEGRVVGLSSRGKTWLLLIPSLTIDGDSNDFRASSSSDLLMACRTLQDAGQAHLKASLQMIIYPQDGQSASFPKFSLQLELVVALAFPAALENIIPKGANKKSIFALEDARRRLLHAAYISDEVCSTNVNNSITISSFYTTLSPAPPLLSPTAETAMQPEALLPSLLPFQRRSVAWLLEREGMSVTWGGKIDPQTSSKAFSFWQEVHEGNHTWYINRLSGELLNSAPILPTIYGGMLAEEPGLGKTVETIALILLNPAPPDWNPTLSRWDPYSRLDIKAIKSTLIVTPPALASQWKDELAAHAPSLKVLVYDGWTKVKVPVTQTAREQERISSMKISDAKSKKKARKQDSSNDKKKGKKAAGKDDMDDGPDRTDLTKGEDGKPLEWCDYVHQFDVVITTYSVLRSEIYVARPAPDRLRREDAEYGTSGRARSPLVMVEWKRVVMDEVQMVGGGRAAEMVSFIPRLSSFAVSGTPAKSQMSDLIHVLKFLRIDQLVGSLRLWNRLLKPGFSEEFASFLQHYGIRTMKSGVTAELTIPEQTRYLVGIELGRVERHVYDQTLEQILLDLGLDARGVAATSNWQVDSGLLRSSLRRLRGICTHPQVGQLQKKGEGLYKPGTLKTIDAVLQSMRDLNWKNLLDDWRAKIQLLIRHAQLQQKDDSVPNHRQNALRTLDSAEKDTNKYLEEITDMLAKHDAKGKEMKEEAALLRQQRGDSPDTTAADEAGKGKAREKHNNKDEEGGDDDPEEKDLPKTPAGEEHRTKRRAIKQRLRDGLLILHRINFLQGDVYHVLGDSAHEDASYQTAEKLRRQLLKSAEDDVNKAMALLSGNASKKKINHSELLVKLPLLGQGGIRSADLMEEVNAIIEKVLNEQAELLWKWRTHIMDLLTQALNPGETEADGQEYQRTLDDQGEAETYLQAYAALLADRREALINERTLLAAHDVREKQLRHTKAAMKAAATAADIVLEAPEGLDLQPEHEVLHHSLSTQRKDILLHLQGRAVKSILVELHGVYVKILNNKDPEKVIVEDAIDTIRLFMSEQTSLHDKLETDLTLLRKSFNQRILYFRQLQEISDSVAEVEWEEESVMAAIRVCVTEKANVEAKMNTTRARYRYLDNLSQNQNSDFLEDEKDCVLCRCEFARGYVTHCGHVFCEMCMKAWLFRKAGKTCPVCRVAIDPATVQRFTINAIETEPPPQLVAGEPAPQSHRKITYNAIDPTLFEEVQRMETYGDFGSKVQTLVRHLVHLKHTDPGAKSIIFSAWADSLHIVEYALRENGIRSLRIDQGSKNGSTTHKFRTDPDILVLLLHGERENAGLNVTCASRVFLLESVVHHSFEIQAIARIDRLGQTRPTEVYCYYAEDTIERNILDLAARKGLSLYTTQNSKGTVSVSPFNKENEQAVDDPEKRKVLQKGDFIYKVDDMLAILFPHLFEDLEFLLPPTVALPSQGAAAEDVEMADVDDGALRRITPRGIEVNAVAGPSRIR